MTAFRFHAFLAGTMGEEGILCALLLMGLPSSVVGRSPIAIRSRLAILSRTIDCVLSAIFILEGRLKSKEQVTKDLAAIDVQVDRAGFFWGRWESSKWGYGAFGGIEYPAVAGGRTWGARNIFVGFDQKRMVTTWTVIDDKKLFHQLDLLEQKGFRPRGQRLW